MRITREALRSGIRFTLFNFATPIAFYVLFNIAGAKPAIALAIGVTLLQVFAHAQARQKPTPFFIVATGFTVGFGMIDLFLTQPRYFRLEAFAQNFIIGAVFAGSVLTGKPIVAWFASALPEQFRPRLDEHGRHYLKGVTLVWAAYFFAKAFLFLYIALRVDLGRLVLLRTIIGGSSFIVMFAGEFAFRKLLSARRRQAHG